MEKTTKVYELKNKVSAYFETRYCGVNVPLSFVTGQGSTGTMRSELVVTDRFTQDAIEHDPRFGKDFFLAATFNESGEKVESEPKPQETVIVRKTRKQLEAERSGKPNDEAVAETKVDAEAEAAQKRSEAAKKAAATRKAKAAKESEDVKEPTGSEQNYGLTFANVNEAITYFMGKGIAVTPDNLNDILAENKAVISE